MSVSFAHGQNQALEQRQRLSQRGQAAVKLLGLSFEDAEAMIEAEALSNPALHFTRSSFGSPISEVIEATLASKPSLIEHLSSQLALIANMPEFLQAKAKFLIGCLDDRGFLRDVPDWIETRDGSAALRAVQSLEPAGIGARHLMECFALQLRRRGEWSDMWAALFDHAELIEAQKFPELARRIGIEFGEIRAMLMTLKGLNAAPGHVFGAAPVDAPPDLVVKTLKSGELVVDLIRERQVRVGVDRRAVAALRLIEHDPEHAAYVKDQLSHARWVRHICRQRGDTLLKVARYAVALQHHAVTEGLAYIRPLTLRAAAEFLDLHESTVSRAVAHKAIETPIGVMPLRALFSGVSAEGAASVTSVRESIKAIIDAEKHDQVFCDADIAARLANKGVVLSRRCVAKHRNALGIAGVRVRRRRLALCAAE
ncbi:MAG: hypothetical protein AAFX09_08590 [Pseudomonadota bacterium]